MKRFDYQSILSSSKTQIEKNPKGFLEKDENSNDWQIKLMSFQLLDLIYVLLLTLETCHIKFSGYSIATNILTKIIVRLFQSLNINIVP